jgi:hypothetical protein
MVAKSMKASTYQKAVPLPKKGVRRLRVRKDKRPNKGHEWTKIKYVRHGQVSAKSRNDRTHWSMDLIKLSEMSPKDLILQLLKDGILRKWENRVCPFCAKGLLGALVLYNGRWVNRCRQRLPAQG